MRLPAAGRESQLLMHFNYLRNLCNLWLKKKVCALFEYFLQSFEFFYFAITKVFYSALGVFWRYGRKILCNFTVKSLHIVCGLRNYYYLCTRKTNRGVEQW